MPPGASVQRPTPGDPVDVLWEREDAMAAVVRLLDDARSAHGRALFVVGDAGLGKTAMLARAKLLAGDLRVGSGRGDSLEAGIPLGLITQALGGLGCDVAGPHLATPSASMSAAARSYAVLRRIRGLGREPILLTIDDLHWADSESLALVAFLCRRITDLPVAVLATLRRWPPSASGVCAHLVASGDADLEVLGSLSATAASWLLRIGAGRKLTPAVTRSAVAACGGNPALLATAASRLGRGEGLEETLLAGGSTAGTGSRGWLQRFAPSAAIELRYAEAAAVLGVSFRHEIAVEVAELDEPDGESAYRVLAGNGLLRPTPGADMDAARTEFVHPLVCREIQAGLAQPARTRLHARAFVALMRRGLGREACGHALAGDLYGNAESITTLEASGSAALRQGDLAGAVDQLQTAVELAHREATAELLLALAEALLARGRPLDAIPIAERAARATPAEVRTSGPETAVWLRVRGLVGRGLSAAGHPDRAVSSMAEAARAGEGGDDAEVATLLLDRALVNWGREGLAAASELARRAGELTVMASEPIRRRVAGVNAFFDLLSASSADVTTMATVADLAEQAPLLGAPDLIAPSSALPLHARAAMLLERFDAADGAYRSGLEAAEGMGAGLVAAELAAGLAESLLRQGRLQEALAVSERGLSPAPRWGCARPRAEIVHAELLLHVGDAESSDRWRRRAHEAAVAQQDGIALMAVWHLDARLCIRDQRLSEAADLYTEVTGVARRLGIGEPCLIPWARDAVVALARCGRAEKASGLVRWLERQAARLPCRRPRIAALAGRAILAEQAGDLASASRHLDLAVALCGEASFPLEAVPILLQRGHLLRQEGRAVQARRVMVEASRIAIEAGSTWLAAQADEDPARAGGRWRGGRHPATLTPQERRVAQLAADGHSNQEIAQQVFVTVNTIETHLKRVYAKLQIHSRRQLMTMNTTGAPSAPFGAGKITGFRDDTGDAG